MGTQLFLRCRNIDSCNTVYVCVQLFKRRNVATADEETEEEVMSDGGFHETQMNNMEMTSVSAAKY